MNDATYIQGYIDGVDDAIKEVWIKTRPVEQSQQSEESPY